jgi:hypothetical protein
MAGFISYSQNRTQGNLRPFFKNRWIVRGQDKDGSRVNQMALPDQHVEVVFVPANRRALPSRQSDPRLRVLFALQSQDTINSAVVPFNSGWATFDGANCLSTSLWRYGRESPGSGCRSGGISVVRRGGARSGPTAVQFHITPERGLGRRNRLRLSIRRHPDT